MVKASGKNDSHQISTLVELLRQRARRQPDRAALHFLRDGENARDEITYAELDDRARSIAWKLQQRCDPSERVLLLYPPGLAFAEAFFGCLYAGAIAVPTYPPRHKRRNGRIERLATDSGASLALTTAKALNEVADVPRTASKSANLEWQATDDSMGAGEGWRAPVLSPNSVAYLQYTSGSTSEPKGVMVSHANVLHNCACAREISDLSPDSVSVSWLPTFHDMGLVDGLIQPIFSGFLGVLMSPSAFLRRPIRWLTAISRYGATHAGGPNVGYELCVTRTTPEERDGLDLRTWTTAYNGAEPVRRQTLEAFAHAFKDYGFEAEHLLPVYGLAEATLVVSGRSKRSKPTYFSADAAALEQDRVVEASIDRPARSLVGCGPAALDTRIVIANPQSLTRCAPDEIGEIWLSGPSVTLGYWNRSADTKETFGAHLADSDDGPFLRTGDLGFLRNEELFVTGRLKHLIIIRGRNLYPQDIELTVERSHPALRPHCGAAFSFEVSGSEQLVIAQEVLRTALRALDPAGVFDAIRSSLSDEHEVQAYEILLIAPGVLPKTSSGKIARTASQEAYLAGRLDYLESSGTVAESTLAGSFQGEASEEAQGNRAPRSELEIRNWIANELARKFNLDVTTIDPAVHFTDYGLDSLSALEIMENLQTWIGRQLPDTVLWDYPTPGLLASRLAGSGTSVPLDDQTEDDSTHLGEPRRSAD